jgi:predicted glycosyltransferase involved in capsule biosynthesis
MNRFHHLKRTLLPNLENITYFGSKVEWVVLNYNSQDEMNQGLRDYMRFIASGHLTYYRTTDFPYFNHAHSKNLSHLLAGGDYVMNLDADNFIDIVGITRILKMFRENADAVIKGYGGLVGLKRSHFLSLGGYDEDLHGWGYEENDLITRARRLGLPYAKVSCLKRRIEHNDRERFENFDPALLEEFAATDLAGIKRKMAARNQGLSTAKSQEGKIRANEKRVFGKARVMKNFSNHAFEVGWMTGQQRRTS